MTRYVIYHDWNKDICDGDDSFRSHVTDVTYRELFDGNRATSDRTKYMTCKNCGAVIWGYHIVEEQDIP